jgi:DNA-binding CsgD family transcriptional regulator
VSQGGAGQARPVTLVGREPEQARLVAAAQAARTGRGRIVLISGEPGIGKTALLTCLVAQAAGTGSRIASGAAEELERRVPFAAITDCLGAGAAGRDTAGIAALLRGSHRPPGGTLPTADTEFLITEAILGLVDEWCASGPVVLAIDDLQWADPGSLLVLHRLGRVAGQLPLLIAATRRSGGGGADMDRLIRSWEARNADLISLGPLDERSVASLTGQALGAQPTPGLLGMITAAAGNPLYVIELARAVASGAVGSGGEATAVPESLVTVVARRLAGLSDRAREILPVAAILGPGFTVAELSAVLATPALELIGVVQEAVAAGVLTAESDRLVFRHEVIRQALQENLPASARNALHLQAGQALAAAGAPVERAAQHLLAGMTLDRRTLTWLAESADRLSARAPGLAADLLRRAVDTADPAGAQAVPLRLALAGALLRAGRFAEAQAAASAGLAVHDGPGTSGKPDAEDAGASPGTNPGGRLRWILVQASLNQGHVTEALQQAQQALDGGGLSRVGRARFHGLAAQCLHVLSPDGPGPAMQAAEGARAEGMASGDPVAMAYGLQAVAGASRWQGQFGQALDLASQAVAALDRAGPIADSQLDPQLIRANCLFDLDRDAEAREAYAADLRLAERGTGTFFLGLHHLSVARMCFLTGRWDDAVSEISTAREAPDHLGVGVHLDGLAALIAVHRQDRDALAALRAALDRPLASGTVRHTLDDRSWGRGLALLADGDRDAAFGVLAHAWQECVAGNREYCGHYLLPDLAALAGPLGEATAARQAVAALDRYLAGRDTPSLRRSARFATAILDGDPGALLDVAAAYAAAGRPLLESQAREHAADLLAAAGRAGDARIQLDAAQDCYARLDAVWDAARADARLRAHGIRRGTHGPRRRPKSGWAALTETERKVAALLAEGLSNPDIAARMFTSRRTVQYHVSNILAKLGLSSRVELATLVTRRAG